MSTLNTSSVIVDLIRSYVRSIVDVAGEYRLLVPGLTQRISAELHERLLGEGLNSYLVIGEGQEPDETSKRLLPVSLTTMVKNVGFILKNVPSAAKKAEEHFKKAIEVAKEIGSDGLQGHARLDMGRLHKAKGRSDQAQDCFKEAIEILEKCESEVLMKQAKDALASLE